MVSVLVAPVDGVGVAPVAAGVGVDGDVTAVGVGLAVATGGDVGGVMAGIHTMLS